MHLNIAIYCAFYEITARNFTIGFPKSELMELALWHLAFGSDSDSEIKDPLPMLLYFYCSCKMYKFYW